MARQGFYPPLHGSSLVDAAARRLLPGSGGGSAEDTCTPRPPPPTALTGARPPLFPGGPPPYILPKWHAAVLRDDPPPVGVPACCGRFPWLCVLTDPRARPTFTLPKYMGGYACVLNQRPAPIGQWERYYRVSEGPSWNRLPPAPLPGGAFTAPRREGLGAGVVPRSPPPTALLQERDGGWAPPWEPPAEGFQGGEPASTSVDVYFSAGRRVRWGENNAKGPSYTSCDDGNDRNCDIWRVRVSFAMGLARIGAAARGYPKVETNTTYDVTYTSPAVSPDGAWVAFKTFMYTTHDLFATEGDNYITTAKRDPSTGNLSAHYHALSPPGLIHGGIDSPAWMGDDQMLVGNGRDSISFHSVFAAPVAEQGGQLKATASLSPLRGPAAFLAMAGVTSVDDVTPEWVTALGEGITDAADPHHHADVSYAGARRGDRVVAFGEGAGETYGVSRVFDPMVEDPYGVEWETPALPEGMKGCHHPTWNPSGDLFQCSHQQTWSEIGTTGRHYRTLHGFHWRVGKWRTFDGSKGHLFPQAPAGYPDAQAWWDDLPTSLLAAWPGLADLVAPGDLEDPEALLVWKYGFFCGSDQWVLAQFALIDEDWAQLAFGATGEHPNLLEIRRFGQKISRVVLINLASGKHYDLTSSVATALGVDESVPLGRYVNNVVGIYPTCTEPLGGASRWTAVNLDRRMAVGSSLVHD